MPKVPLLTEPRTAATAARALAPQSISSSAGRLRPARPTAHRSAIAARPTSAPRRRCGSYDPRQRDARWSTSSFHAKLHGMGWLYEEHAAHEGYVIGYVARDGRAPEAGLYRELAYPRDDGGRRVACIAAGCDCLAGYRRGDR